MVDPLVENLNPEKTTVGEAREVESSRNINSKQRRVAGLIIGVVSVCASVVQQELNKCLEEPNKCPGLTIRKAMDQPYLLVCWCHAWPFFILPCAWIYTRRKRSTSGLCLYVELKKNGLSWGSLCALGLFFAVIRKGDWFQIMALYGIPVGTNVSLYSSYTCLVYVFSLCILKEKFELYKMFSVVGCMSGVFLYSYTSFDDVSDKSSSKSIPSWLGITFGLTAALCMATFQVLYKLCLKHRRSVNSLLLVNILSGFIGLFSIVPCVLFVFAINAVPDSWVLWEPVILPEGTALLVFILVGLLGFILNVGYQIVLLLLPINVASTLWLIQIPLSLLADFVLYDLVPNSWQIGGALLLLASLSVMQWFSK